MTEITLYVVESTELLAAAGAAAFIRTAQQALDDHGRFDVALSGGSTPKAMYTLLAENAELRHAVSWEFVHIFWGDERCVPPDHPDSNYKMAHDTFLSKVPIAPDHIHRMRGELESAEQAAIRYEADLREAFDLDDDEPPRFDLVLLGMGSDGHTASLFPGTSALEATALVASNWVGKLFSWRITLTAPVINNAENVLFMIAGEDKALALKGVLEGLYEPSQLPAQLIQPVDGNLTYLLDPGAASQLKGI
jgi:6-phosphogluconolactonase